MPVIVIHTEPTYGAISPCDHEIGGALPLVLVLSLIVSMTLAWFLKRWR